jgi:hypothetical protein
MRKKSAPSWKTKPLARIPFLVVLEVPQDLFRGLHVGRSERLHDRHADDPEDDGAIPANAASRSQPQRIFLSEGRASNPLSPAGDV